MMLFRHYRPAQTAWLFTFVGAALGASALLAASPARAEPCGEDKQCASMFCVDGVCCDKKCDGPCEACSAIAKGSGSDGTCGLVKAGSICDPAHCDGASFSFVDDATCNAAGTCVYPAPVNCLHNNPCELDLCGADGCETVKKLDGTVCGNEDEVCVNGVCGGGGAGSSSSTAASGSSSGSGGGDGGAGDGGGGSGGGSGGMGGSGGDLYPPVSDPVGCGCGAAADAPGAGVGGLGLLGLALLYRRARPRSITRR